MAITLAMMNNWKRPKAKNPFDPNEKYEWHRPSARGGDIKTDSLFTSEFMPSDKGWDTLFFIPVPFTAGIIFIRKNGKILINLRCTREWYRQRREDFEWLHGLTEEEAADRQKWVESSNARQEHFRQLGLIN